MRRSLVAIALGGIRLAILVSYSYFGIGLDDLI